MVNETLVGTVAVRTCIKHVRVAVDGVTRGDKTGDVGSFVKTTKLAFSFFHGLGETAMKSCLLLCALLLPGFGFAASLTGSVTTSTAAVNLASVGTLDWARWPGYKHKSGVNLISDIAVVGDVKNYTNDPRIIGDSSGVKVGNGAQFEITVPATNSTRTLVYYVGGWNSTAELTVTLPGATTYTTKFSGTGTYSRVVTLTFKADNASGSVLRVRFRQTAGADGSIKLQAAALQGASLPTVGSAKLTWRAPTTNTNGTFLNDLVGYKVYWGKTQGSYTNSYQIYGASAVNYTVTGLASGRWYFAVTTLAGSGKESAPSNVVSKVIP